MCIVILFPVIDYLLWLGNQCFDQRHLFLTRTWFRYAVKSVVHLTQACTQLLSTYHLAFSCVLLNPHSFKDIFLPIMNKFEILSYSCTVIFASWSSLHKHLPIKEYFNPDANCLQSDRLTRRSFVRNRITDTPRPRSAHARAALLPPSPSPYDRCNHFKAGSFYSTRELTHFRDHLPCWVCYVLYSGTLNNKKWTREENELFIAHIFKTRVIWNPMNGIFAVSVSKRVLAYCEIQYLWLLYFAYSAYIQCMSLLCPSSVSMHLPANLHVSFYLSMLLSVKQASEYKQIK